MNNNQYYRYCFSCEKWKDKSEINEVNYGPQPGGGSGKSYNCNVCRKDLGENIQIFRCPDHEEEILKVQGTLEGENKEKIFYQQCPQKEEQESSFWDKIPTSLKIGGAIVIPLGLLTAFFIWWNKTSQKIVKDKFKPIKDIIDKKNK